MALADIDVELSFQMESLKLIALRMLVHSPYYRRNKAELAMGLKVAGELGVFGFNQPVRLPVRLLVCEANDGARSVAEEVKAEAGEGDGAARIDVCDAHSFIAESETGATPQGSTVLLLYLTKSAFLDSNPTIERPEGIDSDRTVAALVKRALDLKFPIARVQEQDAEKGASYCATDMCFLRS